MFLKNKQELLFYWVMSYELFFMIHDDSYQNKQTNVLNFGVIIYPHSIDKI